MPRIRIPLPPDNGAQHMVRASGPALVMGRVAQHAAQQVSLGEEVRVLHAQFENSSTRFARVDLELPGEYLIEVIRTFRWINSTSPNASSSCVEPNDLMVPVFLGLVDIQRVGSSPAPRRALWVRKGDEDVNATSFVLTRSQTCRRLTADIKSAFQKLDGLLTERSGTPQAHGTVWFPRSRTRTMNSPSIAPQVYSWIDDLGKKEDADAPKAPPRAPGLCLVGDSHPARLCSLFHSCLFVRALFPEDDWLNTSVSIHNYTNDGLKESILAIPSSYNEYAMALKGCRSFVLQFGQWDLGYPRGYPTPLKDFEDRLGERVRRVQMEYAGVPIYLLGVNLMPFNCRTTDCAAGDWRWPPLVEEYNEIVHRTCKTRNVECIEHNDIQEPMWDTSPDWNHPHPVMLAAVASRVAMHVNRGRKDLPKDVALAVASTAARGPAIASTAAKSLLDSIKDMLSHLTI